MIPLGIAPGPKAPFNIESFLKPFLDEVNELRDNGFKVVKNGQTVYAGKVHILGITGDIPGIAKIMGHSGHTSHYGCRICKVHNTRTENIQGMYFPGEAPLRSKREWMSNNDVRRSTKYIHCPELT